MGTILLEVSMGRDFGALKGLMQTAYSAVELLKCGPTTSGSIKILRVVSFGD